MHDPQALVGQVLSGKYQVRRLVGRGGMGAVYEGQNVEIGKRVAIKTIDQGHSMSGELATRLRREARATAAVESSHIVQVFDVGEDPKCGVYMVMEFLDGEDLSHKLQREGKLDPVTAVNIATQVGRALVKAHAASIVHRDLKPGNVFLTQREEGGLLVKVVDFGISKLLRDDPSLAPGEQKNLTRMGTALGTPQYMSPEQAQGNTNVDHRTDVWALGCLLYEMLAGKTPYEDAGTYEMTIVRILTTRPQPLLAVAPWVPPQLAQVIDSALVHEWAQRMPDAATFVRMMNEALQLEPQHTGRQSAVQVQPYALPRSSSVDVRAVSLGATLPMSGEHESMVAAARAQLSSGPYVQPQPIIAHSGSHTAVSVDEAPVAGRAGSAILFVGLGALVVALGVGGWVLFGRGEDRKPVPASKPVETAAVESAKNKTEEPPPAPEKKPDPAPSASASASSKPVKDASPIKSGKLPTGKASAVATASAAGSSTGAKTGSGFGGAGVSESY